MSLIDGTPLSLSSFLMPKQLLATRIHSTWLDLGMTCRWWYQSIITNWNSGSSRKCSYLRRRARNTSSPRRRYNESSPCATWSGITCCNLGHKFVFPTRYLNGDDRNEIILSLPFNATDYESALLLRSVGVCVRVCVCNTMRYDQRFGRYILTGV